VSASPANQPHADVPPVSDGEATLRRVPPNCYPPKQPLYVNFLPRKANPPNDPGDADGLSVNREHLTTVAAVSRHPTKPEEQNVARLLVKQIREADLTVVADPVRNHPTLPDDPSHALIPEINNRDYAKGNPKRGWIKEKARLLALDLCEMVHICPASSADEPA